MMEVRRLRRWNWRMCRRRKLCPNDDASRLDSRRLLIRGEAVGTDYLRLAGSLGGVHSRRLAADRSSCRRSLARRCCLFEAVATPQAWQCGAYSAGQERLRRSLKLGGWEGQTGPHREIVGLTLTLTSSRRVEYKACCVSPPRWISL